LNTRNETLQTEPDTLSIDPAWGFLPVFDPLVRLPRDFQAWEEAAAALPKILAAGRVRQTLAGLPPFATARLRGQNEFERAMVILSYFGHAYVWGAAEIPQSLPAGLAVPWVEVAGRLGRPPVLSYASYALYNWKRFDPEGPVALGNIALLQNFLGGLDEEWFILVHVQIEAQAAPALAALPPAQAAVAAKDKGTLESCLETAAAALEAMCRTLDRMPENCDPYIYYSRVRPYIHGWRDNPGLPGGIVYEGVAEYGGKPQQFRGETGAQSAIIPSLDAALGIAHKDDPLRVYLRDLRRYMPPPHREFVRLLETGPSIRRYVLEHRGRAPSLAETYNACIRRIERFRSRHFEYAARYIQKQHQQRASNPTEIGTGGTPFLIYLRKHRDESTAHLI